MGINFPSSPLVGDLFPTPPLPGVPQYRWDGTIWATAPYTATDYVKRSGDSMTGALSLPGNAASALQAVPKQQLETYAAPLDALSYSGMQVNGSMEVSQENGPNAKLTSGHSVDSWFFFYDGTMTAQSGQSPTTVFPGFSSYLYVLINTPQLTLGPGHQVGLMHLIEGYRISRLGWGTANAKPLTIGFWTHHSRAGLYCVGVRNIGSTRSYVATYTATANIAQYHTITIPGCTDGTWAKDNTLGLTIVFTMAAGSTYTAPAANVWTNGNFYAAPGQVNAADGTHSFGITGLVVLPGIYAPTAAQSPLIMRPYDAELLTCMRYYQKFPPPGVTTVGVPTGALYTTTSGVVFYNFPIPMRAAPTLTGLTTAFEVVGYGGMTATPINPQTTPYSLRFDGASLSSATYIGAPLVYLGPGNIDARL